MVETETEKSQNPWMDGQDSAVESRVEEVGLGSTATQSSTSDVTLGFGERAVSAAGAAFLSAIIVNPLDVVKVGTFTCPCFFLLLSFWVGVWNCGKRNEKKKKLGFYYVNEKLCAVF